jgi:uncharacterized protein (TIGR03084 family)
MAVTMAELAGDLQAESAELIAMLDPLDVAAWDRATPAEGWMIRDQVSHLAWNDDATLRAITDPEGFIEQRPTDLEAIQQMVDRVITDHRHLAPAELLDWFEGSREALLAALIDRDPSDRLPWFGPHMSVASKITARLMETWAHTQDVADALHIERDPSPRIRHVIFLGLRAIPNTFRIHGRPVPETSLRVELDAPDGSRWTFGPPEADDLVTGPALDLALVVTQRRHRADTALIATGAFADDWLDVAQAYAGPPGPGREPLADRDPR